MAVPTGISSSSFPNSFDYAEVITKSDTVNLSGLTRAIYVGATGNITAVMGNGDVVLFSTIPAGMILPIRCIRVNSTATSAATMVALY